MQAPYSTERNPLTLIRRALPTALWLGPLFVGAVAFALVVTP